MNKLYPINEILGAICFPHIDDDSFASIQTDAKAFVESNLGIEIPESIENIEVIENTNDTIHLALPYYDSFTELSAELVIDSSLDDVSGGEILITVGAAIGIAIGASITTGIVGTGATFTGVILCGVVGGLIGGTLVAGAVSGAVLATDAAAARNSVGQGADAHLGGGGGK